MTERETDISVGRNPKFRPHGGSLDYEFSEAGMEQWIMYLRLPLWDCEPRQPTSLPAMVVRYRR